MEKIQIILEAVQNAQTQLAATVKQINEITEASKKQQGVVARLNKFLDDQEKLLLAIKVVSAAVVGAMLLMGKAAIENADKLGKQANQLGTSVERLSAYTFAARKANVSNEEFGASLAFLARALGDAQTEGTAAAKAFKQLGLDPKAFSDPLDALDAISEAFHNSEGAAVKANIAQDLFGRGSQRNIAFLNEGSAALKANAEEAKVLGLAVGPDFAKSASTFNDNMTSLKGVVVGTASSIVQSLLPSLLSAQQFFLQNREVVQTLVVGLSALAVAISVGTVAWKAYVIAGQAAAAILGLGAVANAKDYAASISLIASTPWAAYTAGAAGAVAIIVAGVEAWKAYKAAQEEALSTKRLQSANEIQRDTITAKIKELEDAGKIAADKAAELRAQIEAAFAETKTQKTISTQTSSFGTPAATSTVEVVEKKSAAEQASALHKVGEEVIALNREALGLAATADKTKKQLTALVPDDVIKARAAAAFDAIKGNNDTQLLLFKNSLDQQEAELKLSFDRRLVSINDFTNQQKLINEKRFLIEQDFAQREADNQKAAAEAVIKDTSDPATRIKANADIVASQTQLAQKLAEIDQRRFQSSLDLDNRLAQAHKTLNAAELEQAQQAAAAAATKLQQTIDQNQSLRAKGLITSAQATDREIAARATYLQALKDEETALQGILTTINALNAQVPGLFSPEEVGQLQNQIGGLQGQQDKTKAEQPIGENDFSGQFGAAFGDLTNQAQITAATIATTFKDVFNSAISSISTGITGLIVGTQTWSQALRQVGLSILTSIVGAIVQMGVRWVATQVLMTAAALAGSASRGAAEKKEGLQTAFTYAVSVGKSAAAIPYVGWILAPIAFAATLAAAIAASAIGGFASGGLVPGSPSKSDNRMANVASGEYIFDSGSVGNMGAGWFAGLHSAIQGGDVDGFFANQSPGVPRVGRASFANGGLVGQRADNFAESAQVNIAFLDTRNGERDFMRREGFNVIIDELTRRGNSLGA